MSAKRMALPNPPTQTSVLRRPCSSARTQQTDLLHQAISSPFSSMKMVCLLGGLLTMLLNLPTDEEGVPVFSFQSRKRRPISDRRDSPGLCGIRRRKQVVSRKSFNCEEGRSQHKSRERRRKDSSSPHSRSF